MQSSMTFLSSETAVRGSSRAFKLSGMTVGPNYLALTFSNKQIERCNKSKSECNNKLLKCILALLVYKLPVFKIVSNNDSF